MSKDHSQQDSQSREIPEEDEELASEIFGKPLNDYLLDGLGGYIERILDEAWETDSEGMISFETIEEELAGKESISAGLVQKIEAGTNIQPTSSGWHYAQESRVYELHFQGMELQVEIFANHSPSGGTGAGYKIFQDTEEEVYEVSSVKDADRREVTVVNTPPNYGR